MRAEVRVVHGGEEVHAAVREAVKLCFGAEGGKEEVGAELGFWALRVDNTLQVERERSRFLVALFSQLTGQRWDVVSSCSLTPSCHTDQVIELFTWIVKKNVNTSPSSDCCILTIGERQLEVVALAGENMVAVNNTVRNVVEAMEDRGASAKNKPSESGYISEEEKKDSKASSIEKIDAAAEYETNPEREKEEISPQIIVKESNEKSPSTPDMLAEIDHEIKKSMENLLQNEDLETPASTTEEFESSDDKNSEKETEESKEPKLATKPKEESPKKSVEVQKSKLLLHNLLGSRPLSPNVSKLPQDDPTCPSLFPLSSSLPLECEVLVSLLHQLFCRQWKTVTSVKLEEGTVIFLRHDPRILPGLGQQALSGLSVNIEGEILLHNATNEVVESVKLFADARSIGEKVSKFSLKTEASLDKGRELLTEVMTVFTNYNFNIYSSLELRLAGRHTNLLLFKPSSVQAGAILGLSLGRGNMLTLDGGGQEEIEAVRETLSSRWPYPIVSDMAVSTSAWSWKVRRYPWRMSYGIKLVDRAVDRAAKMVRQISFPPPNNNDLESGKSLVVFLMKELAEHGWKFTASHNLNTSSCLLHFSK